METMPRTSSSLELLVALRRGAGPLYGQLEEQLPAGGGLPRPPPPPAPPRHDLRPGLPDLSAFPRADWGRALRRTLRDIPDAELGYPDPAGHPRLRAALAAYLGRVRGVRAT